MGGDLPEMTPRPRTVFGNFPSPVEISEVLTVEISTVKSGLSSSFAGKNKSFGPIEQKCTQNLVPSFFYLFWAPLL